MTLIQETCKHPGCTELQCHSTKNYNGTGKPFYRPFCNKHYQENKALNAGCYSVAEYNIKVITNKAIRKGFDTAKEYENDRNLKLAISEGFTNYTDYRNSNHPYLKYRKTFCENSDGRLGFICTCEIRLNAQLQVDHIDGNPENNDPANLQTLCANCHIFKTIINEDHKTPGRKTLKQGGLFTSLISE